MPSPNSARRTTARCPAVNLARRAATYPITTNETTSAIDEACSAARTCHTPARASPMNTTGRTSAPSEPKLVRSMRPRASRSGICSWHRQVGDDVGHEDGEHRPRQRDRQRRRRIPGGRAVRPQREHDGERGEADVDPFLESVRTLLDRDGRTLPRFTSTHRRRLASGQVPVAATRQRAQARREVSRRACGARDLSWARRPRCRCPARGRPGRCGRSACAGSWCPTPPPRRARGRARPTRRWWP